MKSPYQIIASGLGTGYLPGTPGTWGSLAYLGLWWTWSKFLDFPDILLLLTVSILAVIAVSKTLDSLSESAGKDPGFIVIDEWIGMGVSLIGLASVSFTTAAIAFLLFRALDIIKPGPIKWVERAPGAVGIIADDLLAGLCVNFILRVFFL